MKLLVVGAGAVGGYVGARLAEAGVDVTFLVRERRHDQLERDGLRVESPVGNIQLAVQSRIASELGSGYDLALLACKAYDLDSAMDALVPAMTGACCIVPLLNGIAHLDRLDERFGRENILGGTCTLNVTRLEDGTIRHATSLQRLAFGERGGQASPRTNAFAETLARTKLDWEMSFDIEQDLWDKIVVLSALAAVTCLCRANVGEILHAVGGLAIMQRALATNIEIATREGHPPRPKAIELAHAILLDPSSAMTASMLRDLEAGAKVESDHIVGWMLDKARRHALDDTILSLAYTHLKSYEGRRLARRSAVSSG